METSGPVLLAGPAVAWGTVEGPAPDGANVRKRRRLSTRTAGELGIDTTVSGSLAGIGHDQRTGMRGSTRDYQGFEGMVQLDAAASHHQVLRSSSRLHLIEVFLLVLMVLVGKVPIRGFWLELGMIWLWWVKTII